MFTLWSDFDRAFFGSPFFRLRRRPQEQLSESGWGRMNLIDKGDDLHFVAELPGLSKDEIDITLEDGVLTISGEKKNEHAEEKNGYHLRERGYGKFSRSFRLPTEVNPDKVGAHLKDGLLTLTLDKAEQVKPKKIEVKAG